MTEDQTSPEAPDRVECPPARDPAVRAFIVAAMFIGFGVYCFVDGYIRHLPASVEGLNDQLTWVLNHVGAFALPAIGLVPLIYGLAHLRRRLTADTEGIGYVGRERVPWRDVTGLDASKADKGILVLHYSSGGRQGELKLDSYKLQNFRDLVLLVESKVPAGD